MTHPAPDGQPDDQPGDLPGDQLVRERLVRLADSLPAPPPEAGADLARGRRRVRRRRAVAGLGAAAAVVAVAGVATWLPTGTGPGPDDRPGFAGDGSTPTRAIDPATTAPTNERELAFGERVGGGDTLQAASAAEEYAVVVAEVLDPGREHVVLPTQNRQSAGSGTGLSSLGTRIGWRMPGESGLGMVAVTVGRGAGSSQWSCGSAAWTCADAVAPGGEAARTARHDGVLEVAVERPDGQVVTLAADPIFANNSRVPVSSLGLDEPALLAAAADPRLVLPTGAVAQRMPTQPDLAQYADLRTRGEALLVADGETYRPSPYGSSDGVVSLLNVGRWRGTDGTDAVNKGRLSWSRSTSASSEDTTCDRQTYQRCVASTEDGVEVFVGYLADGGWRVAYPGPAATVTVTFEGAGLPVERALPLVTDPAFQ